MKKSHSVGGQAVLEGVMLKSDKHLVVSARNNKGKIVSMHKKLKKNKGIKTWFFFRGLINLVDMLKLGMEALVWSGNVAADEKEELSTKEWITMTLLSLLFVVGLFIVLPFFVTKLITADKGVLFNVIDGLIRIIFFVLYIFFIGLSKDIKRVFKYHGAEHKVVHCYEEFKNAKKVTVKACRKYSPIHPRCGSSFLMIVLIISIIVFSLITTPTIWIRLVARVILLPVIVGLSYEFLKFSAKHEKNVILKVLMWPGLALQGLTTKEPEDKMVEVAIASLQKLAKLDKR